MMNATRGATVSDVLRELHGAENAQRWAVEWLVTGGQAEVFAARGPEASNGGDAELIVKVFDRRKPEVVAAVREEFESLHMLHAALDGEAVDDWTVRTPRPLHILCSDSSSGAPDVLVMTRVPGVPIATLIRRGDFAGDELHRSVVRATVSTLDRYWSSSNRLYGDLNFRNILCDPATRTLSFIDCGIPESAWLCEGVRKLWFPASRDMAYLLFSAAAEWKRSIGRPQARQCELQLAGAVLAEFIRRMDSLDRRESALYEIMACADEHLSRLVRCWTPRGLWRSLVKRKAERAIDEVFGALQSEMHRQAHAEICCVEPSH